MTSLEPSQTRCNPECIEFLIFLCLLVMVLYFLSVLRISRIPARKSFDCVDGISINVLISKKPRIYDAVRVGEILAPRQIPIDTVEEIAETLILWLYCVDALRGKGLRAVVARFAQSIYTVFGYCVDLTLETLALSGLSDEHPTDWVKSD